MLHARNIATENFNCAMCPATNNSKKANSRWYFFLSSFFLLFCCSYQLSDDDDDGALMLYISKNKGRKKVYVKHWITLEMARFLSFVHSSSWGNKITRMTSVKEWDGWWFFDMTFMIVIIFVYVRTECLSAGSDRRFSSTLNFILDIFHSLSQR